MYSQKCTALGQTPSTAFPVCGLDTFHQSTVPGCVNGNIPVPGCSPQIYQDLNPYWYKFTCYISGVFPFTITPNNLGDDYDWQLFDVTNVSNLNSVYTNAALFVVGNWSGSYGVTGASANGMGTIECASNPADNETTFSNAPFLKVGHNYLLMISHFTSDSQSGYSLSFGGAGTTASITDTTLPRTVSAFGNCSADQITVTLNKPMQCKSVSDSDFVITPALPGVHVVSITGLGCNQSFDMDSVLIILNTPLTPGTYQITARIGTDGNTLLDNCNTSIAIGYTIPLDIYPLMPTPMDSITPVMCAPDTLQLVFKKNIQCSSIASDGSDFVITGPFPVTVTTAAGNNCNNGLSNTIDVVLAAPLVHAGIYTITLKQGTDGNTITDECSRETPAGEFLNFTGYDTVSAAFNYTVMLGCKYDSIQFDHNGQNAVSQWTWVFDGNDTSHLQNPLKTYTDFSGEKNIQLFGIKQCLHRYSFSKHFVSKLFKSFIHQAPHFYVPEMLLFLKIPALDRSSTGTGVLAMEIQVRNKIHHQNFMRQTQQKMIKFIPLN